MSLPLVKRSDCWSSVILLPTDTRLSDYWRIIINRSSFIYGSSQRCKNARAGVHCLREFFRIVEISDQIQKGFKAKMWTLTSKFQNSVKRLSNMIQFLWKINLYLLYLIFSSYFGLKIGNLCFSWNLGMAICAEISWLQTLARGNFFTFFMSVLNFKPYISQLSNILKFPSACLVSLKC